MGVGVFKKTGEQDGGGVEAERPQEAKEDLPLAEIRKNICDMNLAFNESKFKFMNELFID